MTTINKYFDIILPTFTLPIAYEKIGQALRIKNNDSFESRKAVFKIAQIFKREAEIDTVLFSNPHYNYERDEECFAYLFTLEKSSRPKEATVIGGFCFRLRDFGFSLQWIWLHPYARNRGLLKTHWKIFEEKFGKDFYVEPPYSHAMKSFLKNTNESHSNNIHINKIPLWVDRIKIKEKNLLKNLNKV